MSAIDNLRALHKHHCDPNYRKHYAYLDLYTELLRASAAVLNESERDDRETERIMAGIKILPARRYLYLGRKLFNYNHMYVFWAVASRLSMKNASIDLGLSLPTVSEKIKAFEQVMGNVVFYRRVRRLEFTDYGRALFERIRPAFEILDELVNG